MYLEVYEVAPVCHPLIEWGAVMRFRQLIAPFKSVIDPARNIPQALRRETPIIPEPTEDRRQNLCF